MNRLPTHICSCCEMPPIALLLYAIVLTPQVPTLWPPKVYSWNSPLPESVSSAREKTGGFFSFLSSTQPQISPMWCHHKKPLLALYTHVILFSVGIVSSTIKRITKLYTHSQCSPYSCCGVREINYPCVTVKCDIGFPCVLWKSPKEKQPQDWTVTSQAHWNIKQNMLSGRYHGTKYLGIQRKGK